MAEPRGQCNSLSLNGLGQTSLHIHVYPFCTTCIYTSELHFKKRCWRQSREQPPNKSPLMETVSIPRLPCASGSLFFLILLVQRFSPPFPRFAGLCACNIFFDPPLPFSHPLPIVFLILFIICGTLPILVRAAAFEIKLMLNNKCAKHLHTVFILLVLFPFCCVPIRSELKSFLP